MNETIYFLCGYLLGSIPFGLILTRMAGLGDIRAIGSKNIGATNVLRTGRKDIAFLTLLLDALKGTAAVLIACYAAGSDTAIIAAGERSGALVQAFLDCVQMIEARGRILSLILSVTVYPIMLWAMMAYLLHVIASRMVGGNNAANEVEPSLGFSLFAAAPFGMSTATGNKPRRSICVSAAERSATSRTP